LLLDSTFLSNNIEAIGHPWSGGQSAAQTKDKFMKEDLDNRDDSKETIENILEGQAESQTELSTDIYQHFDRGEKEPDSGLINFAELAARASTAPPISGAGLRTRDSTPMAIALSDIPLPARSKSTNRNLLVVFSLFAVAIVGSALAFFVVQKNRESESFSEETKMIALVKSELKKVRTRKEAGVRPAAHGGDALLQNKSEEAERPVLQPEVEEEQSAVDDKSPIPAPVIAEKKSGRVSNAARKQETEKADTESSLFRKNADAKEEAASVENAPASDKEEKSAKAVNDDIDDLLGLTGSKPTQEKPVKAEAKAEESPEPEAKEIKKTLSRQDVVAGMKPVINKAGSCSQYATGTVKVRVTVNENGRVQQAQSLGEFANTKAGRCVEIITRVAKFPEFQSPPVTIDYPIVIP
jgi:hypothetical protein